MRIITAALPYANGFLHLGHIASTYLPADIYARFSKLKYGNENVLFVCATDEHGTPIELNAMKYGLEPEAFVKIFRKEHKEDLEKVNIVFDSFYYTHSEENKHLTYMFYEKAKEKGLIYEKDVEALYCGSCERFLPDRFVKGRCPYCGADNQYGDVCEVCGRTYSAKDLLDPRCIICGSQPHLKTTKHVFFALSKLEGRIKDYLLNTKLQEDAKNYALSWLNEGLKDIDITRDAPYFGFEIPDMKDKYFYVWVDAPFGYIASAMNKDASILDKWNSSGVVHFIGKDIVYFHYIYWIAMLIASDLGLPKAMPTRGYLTLNKKKMSKSRGNFIYLRDLTAVFDADMIRYYFARNIPDNIADGDFSYDVFFEKINKELVGIIANLGYRIAKIAEKFDLSMDVINLDGYGVFREVDALLEEYRVKEALDVIVEYAVKCNEKFNAYEPWKLVGTKEGGDKVEELVRDIAVLFAMLQPYIPGVVQKFYNSLGLERESYEKLMFKGNVNPKHLIERISDDIMSFTSGGDVFSQLDLRVGRIKHVKDIKESENLYLIKLDIGNGMEKQVVAGLKKYYTIEELMDKKVVFVNNLKKAKLMGYESQGMLLAASSNDGDVVGLAYVDDPLIIPGSEVVVKGMFKRPKKEISIDLFRKVELLKEGAGVVYKGRELIARSLCKESAVKVDRYERIEDGAKLW